MPSKLYVSNLSMATTSDTLGAHFAQCGKVISATVLTERDSGRSRGFGFVEMSSEEEAQGAITTLDKKDLEGNTLNVVMAKPRADRAPRP
jgi:RNA recognition motif-containing protein